MGYCMILLRLTIEWCTDDGKHKDFQRTGQFHGHLTL